MTNEEVNDAQFVERLRQQDRPAFTRLVAVLHPKLRGFAASLSSDVLAEDILQDAWVAVWKGLPGFQGRSSLTTWLYTIVRNECMARLRKEARIKTVQAAKGEQPSQEDWLEAQFAADGHWQDGPAQWHLSTPEAMLEEQQLLDCISHNMDGLQEDQLAVFRLRELEQIALDDICNILELSHSNVRVLLHRARQKLWQVINHYQETGEC